MGVLLLFAAVTAKAGGRQFPAASPRLLVIGLMSAFVVAGSVDALAHLVSSSGGATRARVVNSPTTSVTSSVAQSPPVTFGIMPADGATGVLTTSPVTINVSAAHLVFVDVSSADGTLLSGVVDPTGHSWQSTGSLVPDSTYSLTVRAATSESDQVEHVSHFTTARPKTVLGVTVSPTEGATVGIGMPIALQFDHPVANQDAILNRLHVTESVPVAGGWRWFTNKELHFRPEVYWPAGDHVTLVADLAGFDAGNGIWGVGNKTVHFTIGDAHITTADVVTHQLTVTSNGQVVATYPLSAGRTNLPTMGGVHITLFKSYVVRMISTVPGDSYDELVYWDVNITDGGEFVHAAPWSTGAQGRSNISHGCINLSVGNATAFYNFSLLGDVVQVTGSPRPASLGDHGTMDWNTPWAQFTPAT